MEYKFWGWEYASVPAVNDEYKGIKTPRDLYDALSQIWCAQTCAPRMRMNWSIENKTLGQCSITAFLAQDIFGGKVFGVPLSDGGFHCYNVVGDCRFDLTSEQFGDVILNYEDNPEQFREVHFSKEEKRLRYEYLREELGNRIEQYINLPCNALQTILATYTGQNLGAGGMDCLASEPASRLRGLTILAASGKNEPQPPYP